MAKPVKYCVHCNIRQPVKRRSRKNSLCLICIKYPNCVNCGVILGKLLSKQQTGTNLCISCYENKVKNNNKES